MQPHSKRGPWKECVWECVCIVSRVKVDLVMMCLRYQPLWFWRRSLTGLEFTFLLAGQCAPGIPRSRIRSLHCGAWLFCMNSGKRVTALLLYFSELSAPPPRETLRRAFTKPWRSWSSLGCANISGTRMYHVKKGSLSIMKISSYSGTVNERPRSLGPLCSWLPAHFCPWASPLLLPKALPLLQHHVMGETDNMWSFGSQL